jgi:hypothetical protein
LTILAGVRRSGESQPAVKAKAATSTTTTTAIRTSERAVDALELGRSAIDLSEQ